MGVVVCELGNLSGIISRRNAEIAETQRRRNGMKKQEKSEFPDKFYEICLNFLRKTMQFHSTAPRLCVSA